MYFNTTTTSPQQMDTVSPSNSEVRFAFPPELKAAHSTDASSDEGSHQSPRNGDNSQALVPYFAKPEAQTSYSPSQPWTPTGMVQTSPAVNSKNFGPPTLPQTQQHRALTIKSVSDVVSPRKSTTLVSPKRMTMKKNRKRNASAGAVAGMVAGIPLGPAGVVIGAFAGAAVTNKLCKVRERRAQRKYEQRNFQAAAAQSKTAVVGAYA